MLLNFAFDEPGLFTDEPGFLRHESFFEHGIVLLQCNLEGIMPEYNTLSQAMQSLKERGYTHDFNIEESFLVCSQSSLRLHPDDFMIDEVYRFEGESNPDDEAVLYAISSPKHNLKGILVNAFGIYSDAASDELMAKLAIHRG